MDSTYDMNADNNMDSDYLKKRKRINRIKMIIILGILILFMLSMILNIVLIIKIYKIDKQLDKIYSYEKAYVSQDLI